MRLWDLREKHGRIVVPEVEATSEEMLVAVEAANTTQPGYAPHYATCPAGGPYYDTDDHDPEERIESDEQLDPAIIEEATGRPL